MQGLAGPEPPSDTTTARNSRPPIIQVTHPRPSEPKPPSIASSPHKPSNVSIIQPPIAPSVSPEKLPEGTPLLTTQPAEPQSLLVADSVHAAPSEVPSTAPGLADVPHAEDIDDSQIDPALLEAVVTALQHVEQNNDAPESSMNISADEPTEPAQQSAPQADELQSEVTGDGTDETPQRPRRKRIKRAVNREGDVPTGNSTESTSHPDDSSAPKPRRARKRTRTDPGATSQLDREEESSTSPRRRRKSTGGRKTRSPAVPSFDADADPGEEIDPTSVTMGTLCDDQGRGRISSKAAQIVSNHAAWRAANREKRARMKIIMEAKKYGRNVEDEENAASTQATKEPSTPNPEEPPPPATSERTSPEPGPSSSAHVDSGDEQGKGDEFDYSQAMSTSRYNVQVRIGPNGETIIDEDSLFVDHNQEEDTSAYTHVEESDSTKFVNSATYSKKARGSRWSAEETELFFDVSPGPLASRFFADTFVAQALSQFGENYELISFVLPGRDRKACKNKFKAEDKRNPARITYCLKNRRPYGKNA